MTVTKLTFAVLTDVGVKREHNEDAYGLSQSASVLVVADGMGGHSSGSVASEFVVKSLMEFFDAPDNRPSNSEHGDTDTLVTAVQRANDQLIQYVSANSRMRGMGTTVLCLLAGPDGISLAHVGDSRAYRVRDDELEQMTEDHSLLNDLRKTGKLTSDDVANFAYKNVIVRALGMDQALSVDTRLETAHVGDAYLLCTDGLTGMVSDQKILSIMQTPSVTDQRLCELLVAKANDNGGNDNITVAIARVVSLA